MARNAAKSKALQPRDGIQSRLEMQKAKAKGLTPIPETEKLGSKSAETESMIKLGAEADPISMVSVNAMDGSFGESTVPTNVPVSTGTSSTPTDTPVQRSRGRGRPSNGINRKSLTLRPNGETVKRLRAYALDNGYDMSDVLDVLVELYLEDDHVAERLGKMKVRRKNKRR